MGLLVGNFWGLALLEIVFVKWKIFMDAERGPVLNCAVQQLVPKHAQGSEKIADLSDGDTGCSQGGLSPRRDLCPPKQYRMCSEAAGFCTNQQFV